MAAHFALELYLPCRARDSSAEAAAKARSAAAELRRRGSRVWFARTIFMPRDEVCLLVFEAASAELVAEAARIAEITFERVVDVELDGPRRSHTNRAGRRSERE